MYYITLYVSTKPHNKLVFFVFALTYTILGACFQRISFSVMGIGLWLFVVFTDWDGLHKREKMKNKKKSGG
ncbi:MAG: hypothetical protein DRP42_05455 [Tenericutes bacterium]|nr:MAG: hypothetical protein DRP42_05455 [Mycoplasmatota bacterium]